MDLARIDLNLLLAFEALMEARSVSRAAARLGLRQPAMSGALARLRRIFGDALFARVGGEMLPSPKALRLAPGVLGALGQLRAAFGEEAPFDPATARATFTLALTDYGSAVLLPGLAAHLRDRAPGVNLRVIGYDKDDAGNLVRSGAADLALGVFPDAPGGIVIKPLFEEHFIGVARAGHPALAGPLTAAGYAALDHALFTVRRDAVGAIDMALAELGLARRVVLTLPHFLALPPTLAASDLVSAAPLRLAAMMRHRRLSTFAIPLDLAPWRLDMMWNPLARSDRASVWLRETVAGVARAAPVSAAPSR